MKLPNTVNIGGLDYSVEVVPNREQTHGTDAPATCVPRACKIYIDGNTNDQIIHANMWHEIIEAIDQRYDLKLDHRTICALETSVYSVVKYNYILRIEQEKSTAGLL